MTGIASQVTSSPRFMLALVLVSAAVVVISQLSSLFGGSSSATPGAGAATVNAPLIDNPAYAALFESPREVPADPNRSVVDEGGAVSPGLSAPVDQPFGLADEGVEVPGIVPLDAAEPSAGETMTLYPTFSWVNVFSDSSTIDGNPVQAGDVITAYDPSGTLAGRSTVSSEGQFGLLAVYEDDPVTPVDEGAELGDVISFKINGVAADVMGPHSPEWTSNGTLLMLNLSAGS